MHHWDLLVVDEAHHLAWSPEAASPRYTMVEQLAATIPGVILLTATPEQLGRSGHFARLRLLDPQRYHDLDTVTWPRLTAFRHCRELPTVCSTAQHWTMISALQQLAEGLPRRCGAYCPTD